MVQKTLFPGQEQKCEKENGHVDAGDEGDGGMNWEPEIDTCTLPCVSQAASGNPL